MSSLVTTADPNACLIVKVPVEQSMFTIDNLAAGIGFLVGLIVGALVALLCTKLCFRDIAKSRFQDAEKGHLEDNKVMTHDQQKLVGDDSPKSKKKEKQKRLKSGKKGKMAADEDEEPLVPILPISVAMATNAKDEPRAEGSDVAVDRGLVDVLSHNDEGDVEVEMANQDLGAVNALERELREEQALAMVQLLRTLLGQQLKKGKLTPEQVAGIMAELQEGLGEEMKQAEADRDQKEQELRKKLKDPGELQEALDKNHADYMIRLQGVIARQRDNVRHRLQKDTDLSDDEIDKLLAEYANNMAHLQHKLGDERARQARNLEERLQRRRLHAQQRTANDDLENKELEYRAEVAGTVLDALVADSKLTDKQRDELMKKYEDDLKKLQAKHNEDQEKQKLHLAEKLKRKREERKRELLEKQKEDKEKFLKKSDKITSANDLVQAYHTFEQQQRNEREELSTELDEEEAAAFNDLRKTRDQAIAVAFDEREDGFHTQVKDKAGLSQADLDRIIEIHNQEMNEWQRMKKDEKGRMKAKMEEQLAQRKKKAASVAAESQQEQAAFREQQDITIKAVLSSQVELSDEARKKILLEHEQNMEVMNNQLQMSRLKQNKALEAKLAKRKAKVAGLKKKQEELQTSKKEMKQKEREKLEKDLANQIAEEEKLLDAERKNAINALKARLAGETEAALKEQEHHLQDTIGRLEVGQVRRQAIINKQDKTIKELEEQLASKVTETGGKSTSKQIDHLLKDHENQMAQLDEKLQDAKYRQEQLLKEKLEAKRIKKERDVESTVENEAAQEWKDAKKRGAGLATAILSQVMLEQRHKMAMEQIEHETQVEMQKQLQELNRELEAELQAELEEQKKYFLAQVAAISKLSKAEVNHIVEDAVTDAGGSDKEAKRLAKEMRLGLQRAKTELTDLGDDDPRASMRRTKTGYGVESDDFSMARPKSGGPKRPRSAFKE